MATIRLQSHLTTRKGYKLITTKKTRNKIDMVQNKTWFRYMDPFHFRYKKFHFRYRQSLLRAHRPSSVSSIFQVLINAMECSKKRPPHSLLPLALSSCFNSSPYPLAKRSGTHSKASHFAKSYSNANFLWRGETYGEEPPYIRLPTNGYG